MRMRCDCVYGLCAVPVHTSAAVPPPVTVDMPGVTMSQQQEFLSAVMQAHSHVVQ